MKDEASHHHHGINVRVSLPLATWCSVMTTVLVTHYYIPTCCAQLATRCALRHEDGFQKCGVVTFLR